MLSQLLKLIESHQGEMTREELCAELGISPDTLQNLLDILARKGKIFLSAGGLSACKAADSCLSSGRSCPGPEKCSLVLLAPRQFSVQIVTDEETA